MRISLRMALVLAAMTVPAASKGIMVRFLAGAPEDSLARYDVYRATVSSNAGALIGSVEAGSTQDTLSFPDTGAVKGTAYRYTIRAVNRAGVESDPSDSTAVGLPRLALPDTLRALAGFPNFTLPAECHPLRGLAPLTLSLADSSQVKIVFDTAAGRLEFRSAIAGVGARTVRAVVRGSYFGKFSDADTVVLLMAAAAMSLGPHLPGSGPIGHIDPIGHIALARLPSGGGWLLGGLPPRGQVQLITPAGRSIAAIKASGPHMRLGPGACGGNSGASSCVLLIRDRTGRMLDRFPLFPR